MILPRALCQTMPAAPLQAAARQVRGAVEVFTAADRLLVLAAAGVVVLIVVFAHYEALRGLAALGHRLGRVSRVTFVLLIVGLLVVHLIEIVTFSVAYGLLDGRQGLGYLAPAPGSETVPALLRDPSDRQFDYVYFSAVCYTTLGFGDLIPHGPIRLLAAVEALTGLLLVAWSASFTYLQMHVRWRGAFGE